MKIPYEPMPDPTIPVILRYRDGRMLKCFSRKQFSVSLRTFQIINGDKVENVPFDELKAVFLVKTLEGRRPGDPEPVTAGPTPRAGRLLSVKFYDGEVIRGRCINFAADTPGFFLEPLETDGNNDRIWVIQSATKEIVFEDETE